MFYDLREILRIPSEIKCYNRSIVDGDQALCIFLKLFAYALVPMFGRSVPELSIISNHVMDYIYDTFRTPSLNIYPTFITESPV